MRIRSRRRRHRRARRHNPVRTRRYHFRRHGRGLRRRGRRSNPMGSVAASVTQGFDVGLLKQAGAMLLGGVANSFARDLVTSQVGKFVPLPPVATFPIGLGTAGLLSWLAAKIKPDLAAPVILGGVLGEATRAYQAYLAPSLQGAMRGFSGLLDMLVPSQVAAARSLGDALTVSQSSSARPLASFQEDEMGALGEEVEGIGEEE